MCGFELLGECWELNPDPQERQVLLTTEPYFPASTIFLFLFETGSDCVAFSVLELLDLADLWD